MTTRVICVGNRLLPADAAGPRVYDMLAGSRLPRDVEIVDGGLGGIDLLRLVEGQQSVVFVDTVNGFSSPGDVVVLRREQFADGVASDYGHAGGLAYLLKMLPAVCEGPLPEVYLVGVEGAATQHAIERMATLCLDIAGRGVRRDSEATEEGICPAIP